MDFCYTFERKVRQFIYSNRMAEKGKHLIIGVSGGADSICLLELLRRFSKEEEWTLTAVHVNHGIRGREAAADERFVENFCRQRGIDCIKKHYNIPLEAELAKEGEEEAGRRLRYQAFLEVMEETGADRIAVAHHKGDQAETVLFHLLRGSSLKGLSGMRPLEGVKMRPLLCADKSEILRYLSERGIGCRVDQSNFSEKYARNYLRLRVIPMLENINAGAVENISRAAMRLADAEEYLAGQERAAAMRLGVQDSSGAWQDLPVCIQKKDYGREEPFLRRRVLYRLLCACAGAKKDWQEAHILAVDALFFKQGEKYSRLPYGLQARSDAEAVWLEKRDAKKEPEEKKDWQYPLAADGAAAGHIELKEAETLVKWRIFKKDTVVFGEKNAGFPKNNYTKWFDYDKISHAALFRTRRAGDWFVMDSSGKHKKLKQYFIDKKIPKQAREELPLFADGSHIIWVMGERISEEYKVQETTQEILEVTFQSIP